MRVISRFRGGAAPDQTRPATRFVVSLLLLLSLLSSSQGRIFNRWRGASQSSRALESIGGKLAYRAEISLNGGDGRLNVYGFESDFSEIAPRVNKVMGEKVFKTTEGTMAEGKIRSGRKALRLLAVDLGDQGQTMVFAIEQDLADFRKSAKPPSQHLLRDIPAYPGAEPVFHARDKNTDMALAVSRAQSTAQAVKGFYDEHLSSKGWLSAAEALTPKGTEPSHTPRPMPMQGFNVYIKGSELCFVMTTGDGDGNTEISILHKQMQMD